MVQSSRLEVAPAGRPFDPVEEALAQALSVDDERGLDEVWSGAFDEVAGYLARPAKRVRPALVLAGYRAAAPGSEPGPEVVRFAAAQELLHGFMLVHDDVADRAPTRRGGPALHHLLAPGAGTEDARLGEQLAVVAGDHLFALAIERMLDCGSPRAAEVTQYVLSICRHTAAGQYLDLFHGKTPLRALTLWDVMRVAQLKTARYGFVAPLVCGAMLAGADERVRETLARAGRHAGVAFQLKDDLIGLFGDDRSAGKSGAGDFFEGKRTFPLIAAWTRADVDGRAELELLWDLELKGPAECERARVLVERWGGRAATERAIERSTRAALKCLAALPPGPGRATLEGFLSQLSRRSS